MSKKKTSKPNQFSISVGSAPIICARYLKSIPNCLLCSCALLSPRSYKTLEPFKNKVELGQNQKGTEIKCRPLDLAFVGIFPSCFRED